MALSEEEATVYDRQIRLWGLEAQQRLQQSRILVIGVQSLAAEICKDIVLAGVGTLVVWDGTEVSEADLGANFLLRKEDIGTTRAEAAAGRLRLLNPRVHLDSWTKALVVPSVDDISQFDIVCMTVGSSSLVRSVNALCRKNNIIFFAGAVHGMHGWLFADLLERSYLEEHTVPSKTVKGETEQVRTTKNDSYKHFSAGFEAHDWASMSARQQRRMNRLHLGMELIRKFETEAGRLPSPGDEAQLKSTWTALAESLGLAADLVSDATLTELVTQAGTELMPVAAIVGGVYGQEIVKAISGKGGIVSNFFYYDGVSGTGEIETFM